MGYSFYTLQKCTYVQAFKNLYFFNCAETRAVVVSMEEIIMTLIPYKETTLERAAF